MQFVKACKSYAWQAILAGRPLIFSFFLFFFLFFRKNREQFNNILRTFRNFQEIWLWYTRRAFTRKCVIRNCSQDHCFTYEIHLESLKFQEVSNFSENSIENCKTCALYDYWWHKGMTQWYNSKMGQYRAFFLHSWTTKQN